MSEFEIDLEEDDGFGSATAEGKVDLEPLKREREAEKLRDRIKSGRRDGRRDIPRNGPRDGSRDGSRDGAGDSRLSGKFDRPIPTGPRALTQGYQSNYNNYHKSSSYGTTGSNYGSYNGSYNSPYRSEHRQEYSSSQPYTSNPDYPTNALHISGLDWWINEEDVRDWIIDAGQPEKEVRSIIFDDNKLNGKSKGAVYIEFNGIEVAKNTRQYIEKKLNLKSSTGEVVGVIYVNSTSSPFRQSMSKSRSEMRRAKGVSQSRLGQTGQVPGQTAMPSQMAGQAAMPGQKVMPGQTAIPGQTAVPTPAMPMIYGAPMMYGFPGFWMAQQGYMAAQATAETAANGKTDPESSQTFSQDENPHGIKRLRDDQHS